MATADADDDATLDTLDGTHRRTLLYDAMGYVGDQIAEIREEIAREMRNTPTTAEMPGSTGKVRVLIERAEAGRDLFIDGDAQVDMR